VIKDKTASRMFIGSSEENLNHEKFHLLDRTQACQQATTHQRPSVPETLKNIVNQPPIFGNNENEHALT